MAFVDSIRMENGSALLDIDLESRRMAVRQGDLIAYTGSTGAGPPHLHFELRTPENEPFNPLLTNLDIDDTIPPVFTGLGVEQDRKSTRLNSSHVAISYAVFCLKKKKHHNKKKHI